MPTYDYRCLACGHRFEAMQRITEAPLSRCPKCKGKVKRLIGGGAGVIFKGSGFYVTDSRASNAAGRSGSGSKNGGSGSSESSSDSSSTKKEPASSAAGSGDGKSD
jgi:putative FmdB family regulatory protein